MKKMIHLLIFWVLLIEVTAQNYTPFPTGNASWKNILSNGYCTIEDFTIDDYFQQGDTTINGINYHKIYKSTFDYPCNMPPSGLSPHYVPPFYSFAIREENKRIYIKGTGNSEGMMYNFDLQVGDTLTDKGYSVNVAGQKQYVVRTDSFFFANATRKFFVIYPAIVSPGSGLVPDTTYLIEGIGTSRGFIPSFSEYLDFYQGLLCVTIDGQGYKLVNYNSNSPYYGGANCSATTALEKSTAPSKSITVFPNPMQNECEIQFENTNEPYTLEIFDITGSLVSKTENISSPFRLTREKMNSGVYYVKVYNTSTWQSVIKLLVL